MADEELLYFNGINGATGDYATQPLTLSMLSKAAQGQQFDRLDLLELNQKRDQELEHKGDPGQQKWAIKEGHDPKDLAQSGWGVIFPALDEKKTAELRGALKPLLDFRKEQAAKVKEHYYKEFIGPNRGVKPNEDKRSFLARHDMGTSGPVDPEKAPYYLLIVGDPEAVPYKFQYQLDVQHAVGRLHFEMLDEYAQYAENVVRAEKQTPFLPPSAAFFGVSNPGDKATRLSAEKLIRPLAESVIKDKPGWKIANPAPADCTKARLGAMLNGPDLPALLFTASHGMEFPNGDERQLPHQGALLCQDWPGPQEWRKPIPPDHYFSQDDVAADANLLGLLAFFFACYGCGTPKFDEFAHLVGERAEIAPHAFLANLPRKMLLRGALAVVGHVERAWGTSFMWGNTKSHLSTFEASLKRLMEGHPVGSAMEYFNGRYAEISSDLSVLLENAWLEPPDDEKVSELWTANNDARSYVVIGDPAARMPVATDGAAAAARPGVVTVSAPRPAAQAQPDAQALADHVQNALRQALAAAPGLQDVRDVNVDVKYDAAKGEFSGAARFRARARPK